MAINLQLEQLYLDDKSDRKLYDEGRISEEVLKQRDLQRQKILKTILPILDESEIWNCHYACLLLMHSWSDDPAPYKLAHEYAKKAIKLGSKVTKWLYAASLDRWLVSQGKPQKFGTQYNLKTKKICDYDPTTSDQERAEYGVPPLSELIKRS
jgi:hypothetical protein